MNLQAFDTAQHIAWAIREGFTPAQVCDSVRFIHSGKKTTWAQAFGAIEQTSAAIDRKPRIRKRRAGK